MNFLVNYGLFLLAWIAGLVVGAFTIGQIIILTSYGIPMAVRLKNKGLFANYSPVFRYLVSLLVIITLLSLSLLAVGWYLPTLMIGYLFGLGMISIKMSGDKVRLSPANLEEFLLNNHQYFTRNPQDIAESEISDYFDINDKDSMDGNQLVARLVGEAISNTLFFGVMLVVVLILGRILWWLGFIAAVIFALVTAASILQIMFAAVLELVAWIAFIYFKIKGIDASVKERLWLSIAAVVRTFESVIDVIFVTILYYNFFPLSH